jgi:hypothetical protein
MATLASVHSTLAPSPAPVPSSFTIRDRGVHPLLKAVRATYRAQHRKPQFEPICVEWIERFVRTYPTRPVGQLRRRHVQTFLRTLAERGEAPERRRQAREALRFLQTDVLRLREATAQAK